MAFNLRPTFFVNVVSYQVFIAGAGTSTFLIFFMAINLTSNGFIVQVLSVLSLPRNVSTPVYASSCANWELRAYIFPSSEPSAPCLTKTIVSDSFTSKRAPDSNSLIKVPGYHKKNQIEYQKDIDRFVK